MPAPTALGEQPRSSKRTRRVGSSAIAFLVLSAMSPVAVSGETCWGWEERLISPASRSGHAAAFDPNRGVMLLFGGQYEFPPGMANDTWEWNGASWRRVATIGPSSYQSVATMFDSVRNEFVLFAGSTTLGKTWIWSGFEWRRASAAGPGPRTGFAMAFDNPRGEAILFGGKSGASGSRMPGDGTDRTGRSPRTRVSPALASTPSHSTPSVVSSCCLAAAARTIRSSARRGNGTGRSGAGCHSTPAHPHSDSIMQ